MKKNRFLLILIFLFTGFNLSAVTITTISDGNWSDGLIWDGGTPPNIGDIAVIAHNVTMNTSATIQELQINAGAKLTLDIHSLTVSGITTINGIFEDLAANGAILFQDEVTLNATGSWNTTAVTNPDFLCFENSLRSNGGTFNAGKVKFQTSAVQKIYGIASAQLHFQEIVIGMGVAITNNCDVFVNTISGQAWNNNTNSKLHIDGSLSVSYFNAIPTNNLVEYTGTSQTVRVPNTSYYHLKVNDGSLNSEIKVKGNLEVLSMTGTPQILLDGTINQTVNSAANLYKMTVDKTSGKVSIAENLTVENTLTMTSGDIEVPVGKLLSIGTGLAKPGIITYSAGAIVGKFKKWIPATGTYTLPTGYPENCQLMTINFNSMSAFGSVIVSFKPTSPTPDGLPLNDGVSIDKLFTDGFWELELANGLIITNFDITLDGINFTSTTITPETRIVAKNKMATNWELWGTHSAATGTVAKRTAINPGVINNMQFALAYQDLTPKITSISPLSGNIGTFVTINGNNFSSTPADNVVYFGATKAIITSAATNKLIVIVPPGALYEIPITVTVNECTAQSPDLFNPTFAAPPVDNSFFCTEYAFPLYYSGTTNGVSIGLGDFDGDGKTDIASGIYSIGAVSVIRNTGSVGSFSFTDSYDFSTGTAINTALKVADIDSDGKLDIVVTNENTNKIYVFRNTSTPGTITFEPKVEFSVGAKPVNLTIVDFNKDGKLDVATANKDGKTVTVLENKSSVGSINFTTAQTITLTYAPYDIDAGDIDNDGKIDLVVALNTNKFGIIPNNTAITINFGTVIEKSGPWYPKSIGLCDLDNDGKLDVVVGVYNSISLFQNLSTGAGNFNIASQVDFTHEKSVYDISFGDLDGDNKKEIVTMGSFDTYKVNVYKNNHISGNFVATSFEHFIYGKGTDNARKIQVGDIDGDGKPEISVANHGNDEILILHNKQDPVANISTPPLPPGNLNLNTVDNVLYRIDVGAWGGNAQFTGATFATGSNNTFVPSDISKYNLWYSTDANFENSDLLLKTLTTIPPAGDDIVFSSFNSNPTIANGSTGYVFLTVDVASNPVNGHTINIEAFKNENLLFTTICSVNGTTSTRKVRCFIAPPGNALDFDGIDDYIDLPFMDFSGSNAITFEAWVKPTDITTDYSYYILAQETVGNPLWRLGFQNYGTKLAFGLNTGTDNYEELIIPINPSDYAGKRIHLAAVYDGIDMILFVNGIEKGRQSKTGTLYYAPVIANQISGYGFTNDLFKGRIDEVRIWSAGLTETQIRKVMIREINETYINGSVAGLAWTDLDVYYQFNNGVSCKDNTGKNILKNISSYPGNNGTLTNFDLPTPDCSSNWGISDFAAPIPIITSTESSPTFASIIPITIDFNKIVNGFEQTDLTVSNATIANFTDVGGGIFTFDLTPTIVGLVQVLVPQNVADGNWGVGNIASEIFEMNILTPTIAGFGYSLDFDGIDDEFVVPHDPVLNPEAGSFTVEMWLKLPDIDQSTVLMEKAISVAPYTQFGLWVNGADVGMPLPGRKIVFNYIENSGAIERNGYTNRDIIDGKWHHIALVANQANNRVYIYVDGINEPLTYANIGEPTWPNITNNIDLRIMCDIVFTDPAYNHSKGTIDEVRIWNTARTQVQIRENMYRPLAGTETGLVGYWRFDENAGAIVKDHSVNNNNANLNNAPTWTDPGAPVRIVTKKDYTDNHILPAYDLNSDPLTYSIITNGTNGVETITNAATGEAAYLRNVYAYDNFTYQVTAGGLPHSYQVEVVPVFNESGHVEEPVDVVTWTADTVKIRNDIYIGDDTTLSILKDTYVELQGHFAINIRGQLIAEGTSQDVITFTVNDTTGWHDLATTAGGWNAIRIDNGSSGANGAMNDNDTTILTYCRFKYGKATNGTVNAVDANRGGALFIDDFSKINLKNCVFEKNSAAAEGGGVYFEDCIVSVNECIFTDNKSEIGGAISNAWARPHIVHCFFENNQAINLGGAIANNDSYPIIEYSKFINNNATYGGAISANSSAADTIRFTNNLINGNSAADMGGAVYGNGSNFKLINNNIVNNSAVNFAGGIYLNAGESKIYNTIFWANTASIDPQIQFTNGGTALIFSHNLLQGTCPASITCDTTIQNGDPKFVDIDGADNIAGTQDDDFHLQTCGSAVNTASDSWAPTFDIDDTARYYMPDIGIYEMPISPDPFFDCVWQGCIDNKWHDYRNWNIGKVPTSDKKVFVPGTATAPIQPTVHNYQECNYLKVDALNGGKVIIDNAASGYLKIINP